MVSYSLLEKQDLQKVLIIISCISIYVVSEMLCYVMLCHIDYLIYLQTRNIRFNGF